MAISLEYDTNHGVLLGRIEGILHLEDMKAALQQVVTAKEYPSDVDTIWDLTRMVFHNIDFSFAQNLVAIRRELLPQRGNVRLALVSDFELAEGVIEVYRVLSESLPQEMRVFCSVGQALVWLAHEERSASVG